MAGTIAWNFFDATSAVWRLVTPISGAAHTN